MLDAGNPYVLPSVLVGAAVYLGLTVATDASLPIRVGALLVLVGVVPVVLNRLLGDRGGPTLDDGDESAAATAGEDAGDEGTR
ncbi:hypothetical protein DJ71_03875 [Halorubrum sp. E3]|uniref:Uncharacterized protein n=5 Tax=Halorubrum distributum TaxID=29283 RepID=M0EQC4_9EURY|nr:MULTISPECIES: hypothetical protein [Halorubrum distributum group]OYR89650.1 hypothetical protein DJ71_03875 [Halorubrum sp. E3]PHQ45838.1 hypothetical protein DJ68_10620 [Halorubrum sp. C3]ELZ31948.1 hypothetical protein C473_10598 [Halorubrum terrestre JCM 10247]ELZ49087.1 hypothetical protein C465_08953 [Halorubrum distributum JCM 9100]ELZ52138.1 hypothetical protein C466_12848 [Halorubrum distributum JCM 10118]